MKKQDISIIIPNYNGEKYLADCLNSLKAQTEKGFETIVVDDCSSDQSLKILGDYPQVLTIVNLENVGFAKSVNNGIRASHGDYLLLLNNDVVVEKDFVEQLKKAMERDEKIFSVSSRMIRFYERDTLDDTGDFYHALGWAYKRGDGKPLDYCTKASKVFSTCAGAGMYRKAVFDEIGLFDEHFFAYLEDVDVSYRGLIHGYENWYEPKAICYHIGSATTADGNKYSPFKVKISARNNVYLVYKNMPNAQLLLNAPFLLVGFAVKGAVFTKRGYGREYFGGLREGVATRKNIVRTPFKKNNLRNYVKLQGLLFANMGRHFLEKCR